MEFLGLLLLALVALVAIDPLVRQAWRAKWEGYSHFWRVTRHAGH